MIAGRRVRASQSRASDGTAVLSVYIVLLIAIPSRLVFAPLGGAGTPAQIIGLLCALWWFWGRVRQSQTTHNGRQPVRVAMAVFAWFVGVSYVAAMARPLSPTESNAANLGLVAVVGWVGVVVVANDGIPNVDRLIRLLRRLATMGGLLAAFGVFQFFTHEAWTEYITIPGLTLNHQLDSVLARGGLSRPAGTATHPIEFGVVLTMLLPIAIANARDLTRKSTLLSWWPVAAIAFAIPLSISRSAIVGAAIGLAVLFPTWPRSTRWAAVASVLGLLGIVFLTVPGMLGTITGLFAGIATDSSAQSRLGAVAVAWEFVKRSPVIGRGYGTFLPQYWILDNQYLGLLIEVGVLGAAALFGLLGAALWAVRTARRATSHRQLRAAGAALTASIAAGGASLALFDALGFAMSGGLLVLVIGLAGSVRRLATLTRGPDAECAQLDVAQVKPDSLGSSR